jgi:hypothetical protein
MPLLGLLDVLLPHYVLLLLMTVVDELSRHMPHVPSCRNDYSSAIGESCCLKAPMLSFIWNSVEPIVPRSSYGILEPRMLADRSIDELVIRKLLCKLSIDNAPASCYLTASVSFNNSA